MPPPVFWTFIRLCTSCARRSQALTGRAHVTGRVNPGHAQTAAMMMSARDVQDATKMLTGLTWDVIYSMHFQRPGHQSVHVLPGGGWLCARARFRHSYDFANHSFSRSHGLITNSTIKQTHMMQWQRSKKRRAVGSC